MKVEILHVGKVKSSWIGDGIAHYRKLLSRDLPVELSALREADSGSLPVEKVRDEEGERIIQRLDRQAYKIILDERGRQLASVEFSREIEKLKIDHSKMQVVVGGAFGLSDAVRAQADLLLSLSQMTLPHELTLLLILEQLYRAIAISKNSKYHK